MAGFSVDAGGGIQVTFKDGGEEAELAAPIKAALKDDDGYTTSPRQVAGFSAEARSGFRHPSLWSHQNGRVLTHKGTLE